MHLDDWLKAAIADVERRGLPELKPLLEALAQATRALRSAGLGSPPALRLTTLPRVSGAAKISAVEQTDECLRRIEADNARVNAFILVMAEEARRQALAADRELAAG